MELYLGPVALAPVIIALVSALKKVGLPEKYAPFANLALSTIGYVVVGVASQNPGFLHWGTAVVNIAIVLLSAWGLYEGTQYGTKVARGGFGS